jgi:hypothetical protein
MNGRHERFVFRISVFATLALLLTAGLGLSQQEDEAAQKARLKKLDSGPKVIDVSKYAADPKEAYALFSKKCSKCHSLARAINTPFVLPSEWERYIKRMVYKPDSKMTDDDGKAIYRFLVYDSSVRKADSLKVHLANLTPDDRAVAVAKIQALNPAFGTTGK